MYANITQIRHIDRMYTCHDFMKMVPYRHSLPHINAQPQPYRENNVLRTLYLTSAPQLCQCHQKQG